MKHPGCHVKDRAGYMTRPVRNSGSLFTRVETSAAVHGTVAPRLEGNGGRLPAFGTDYFELPSLSPAPAPATVRLASATARGAAFRVLVSFTGKELLVPFREDERL